MSAAAHAYGASWFDEVRTSNPDILAVATHLGLGVRGQRFGPCPACNADDPRHPACTSRHGGSGWLCAKCKVGGDVVRLASWVVTGGPKPGGSGWDVVRASVATGGWCSPGNGVAWSAKAAPRVAVELPLPDRRELFDLIRACRGVARSPAATAFWQRRKWGASQPAGVLPDVYPWPAWWPFRGGPYSLVVSMVDAAGAIRSLHARHVEAVPVECGKTRWPYERNAKGLLFADPALARPMLRGQPADVARVIVVEGITDYLAVASRCPPRTAVLGACSGGFAALGAAAIPSNAVVYVATDYDDAGNRYAREVAHVLSGRDVRRLPPLDSLPVAAGVL